MTSYKFNDLTCVKETSEPVRQILFSIQGENESLRQQLTAALAACKMKDEFIRLLRDHFSVSVFGKMVIQEALIIQPNDTALKAWLGEPVACRSDGRCQYAIDHDAEGMGHCPPGECCMPLYSPKGMMK